MAFNHLMFYLILAPHVLCGGEEAAITIDVQEEVKNGSVNIIDEEFTWHVAILRNKDEAMLFLCSGTAVSSEFVISSAKCAVPIPTNELRVLISHANISRFSFQDYKKKDQICRVTKKYYHYHPEGRIVEADVIMLKLQGCNFQQSAQLTNLPSTHRFSKHCFALGWSGQFKIDLPEKSCPTSKVPDIFSVSMKYTKDYDHSFNKVLNMRNILSLSSMFVLKVHQMFYSFVHSDPYESTISQDGTCQFDEFAQRKRVDLSAKHHYKCLCSDRKQICLYSKNSDHISTQVDIGSPVFCKIKKEKKEKLYFGTLISQYALVGVITNTSLNYIPLLKHDSSMGIMKADNVTNFPKLLSALVSCKN